MSREKLERLFEVEKPIIGMIHLSGKGRYQIIDRALEELYIYQEEGVNGAIIENYHGDMMDVYSVLEKADREKFEIVLGVNVLGDPYSGLDFARKFGAKFVQFDSVQENSIIEGYHEDMRNDYKEIFLFGGVGFKYVSPTGNSLEKDLIDSTKRCDAVVTTGSGTEIETPLEKLHDYKKILGNFPLFVGAGVSLEDVEEKLEIADGAIVGSYFKKNGNTFNKVHKETVKYFMEEVRKIRKS